MSIMDNKPLPILAIIGGVGYNEIKNSRSLKIQTNYGNVNGFIVDRDDKEILFIPRHLGENGHIPPHKINYQANIMAINQLGIKKIISINSVGSLQNHAIGSFVLPADFIDFTYNRANTFFEDKTIHTDMSAPYCPYLRNIIASVLNQNGMDVCDDGVYVCTQGPRFETKAEIRMLSKIGDVVGMTGVPEVVLANEIGLCYASICLVTNMACGIVNNNLSSQDILEIIAAKTDKLMEIINHITDIITPTACICNKNDNLVL